MKKILAVLALVVFIGGVSAPAIAANNNALTLITLNEEDPKKKEKKDANSKDAKTEKNCESAEKKPCAKKCGE